MAEWISVKQALPREFKEVLIYGHPEYSSPFYEIAYYVESDEKEKTAPFWLANGGRQYKEKYVSHWRFLPKPPVED